jgi:hypothetical protein
MTRGEIESIDGDTITLTLDDGSTVTVSTDSETTVTRTEEAEVSDLEEGDTVIVRGTTDGDSVAAESISEGQTGFGGGAPPAGEPGQQ